MRNSCKWLGIIGVVATLVFFADVPRAGADIQQLENSVLYQNGQTIDQALGTGLSGSIDSIGVYAEYYSGSGIFIVAIACYDDAAYTLICGGGTDGTHFRSENVDVTTLNGYINIESNGVYVDTFTPTKYYRLAVRSDGFYSIGGASSGSPYAFGDVLPDSLSPNTSPSITGKDLYFWINADYSAIPDTSTRFIFLSPVASSTVATSTTVGAHVYVNESDWEDGTYLSLAYTNQTVAHVGGSALDAWYAAFGTGSTGGDTAIHLPLLAGDNDVATSTVFPFIGRTIGNYKIIRPSAYEGLWLIGRFFGGQTIVASSTSFIVVQRTSVDIAVEAGGTALIDALITGTTTAPILNCHVTSFSLELCLISLIVPPASVLKADFERFRDAFLTKLPLGYVTRVISVMATTTPVALPTLDFTMPSVIGGQHVELDPWPYLFSASSTIGSASSTEGQTFREITEPYWYMLWAVILVLAITKHVIGMRHH